MLAGLNVRLGYSAGTGVSNLGQLREEAVWAESAGFECFWLSQVFGVGVDPIVAQPCPVLIAALGPRMLELAGRATAGTTVGSCGPRTIASHIAPTINDAAERADRPPPRIVAHHS